MISARRTIALVLILIAVTVSGTLAQTGPRDFQRETVETDQQLQLQRMLREIYRDTPEVFVTGPLQPFTLYGGHFGGIFSSVRVVCPDLESYEKSVARLCQDDDQKIVSHRRDEQISPNVVGCRGSMVNVMLGDQEFAVYLLTVQELRLVIWLDMVRDRGWYTAPHDLRHQHSQAVADYLAAIDSGRIDASPPQATDIGLPDSLDIYAADPDYVIEGYQNYKDFLFEHRELTTDFARGIFAFVPTPATMAQLKAQAPSLAFHNKEAARLQEEYREFYERGGDNRSIQTLTAAGFDTLRSGEFFFAVSQAGQIRFGRELTREEVARIETETGRRAPRANHAHLFPGEAITTAGAFFIDERAGDKLVRVNAQSGHFFYSNVAPTVREDISVRSNEYLLTLGHFFAALDHAGIAYGDVLISKL